MADNDDDCKHRTACPSYSAPPLTSCVYELISQPPLDWIHFLLKDTCATMTTTTGSSVENRTLSLTVLEARSPSSEYKQGDCIWTEPLLLRGFLVDVAVPPTAEEWTR